MIKLENLKTKIKMLIATIVPLIFLLIIGLLSFISINKIVDTNELVEHTHKVLTEADVIIESAVDMETGMRGYLLTGNEESLDPYNHGKKIAYEHIEILKIEVHDEPIQVTRLTEIEKTLHEWQDTVTDPLIALRKEVGITKTMDDISEIVKKAHGEIYFQKFRKLIGEFKVEEQRLMNIRKKLNHSTVQNTYMLIAIFMALAISIGSLISWIIGKSITKPLTTMVRALNDMAQGKNTTIPSINAKDEIGDIARAVKSIDDIGKAAIRIQFSLDSVTSSVMLADENNIVIYMNPTATAMMRNVEDKLRESLPNFNVDEIVGDSIDRFHKNPNHQAGLLKTLNSTYTTEINISGVIFELIANPVFADEGKTRVGTVVEWKDMTATREEEQKKFDVESQINETAKAINTATRDISQGNLNLSERTESQAASIQQTTASMQQITERVNETAVNAQEAADLSGTTKDAADRGGSVVKTAITAMAEISNSSKKINEIIGVIDEIAFQTNLLALNAAVEAARAGEQGRGFAVVASEVRNLAGRSAKAAKEIKGLIIDSVDKVEIGTAQVNETGECLDEIIMSVQQVTSMVNTITDAAKDQAQGVEEVNRAITQMDSFTQQNASLVEEAASASSALSDQATNLVEIIENVK